mgnify:FL=1
MEPTPDVINLAKSTSKAVENGIDASIVGQRVLEALEQGEFYIFTHPNYKPITDDRSDSIAGAFARSAESSHLQDVLGQKIWGFSE